MPIGIHQIHVDFVEKSKKKKKNSKMLKLFIAV